MSEWLEWERTSERHHDLKLMPRTDRFSDISCSPRPLPFCFKKAVVGIPVRKAHFLIPAWLNFKTVPISIT